MTKRNTNTTPATEIAANLNSHSGVNPAPTSTATKTLKGRKFPEGEVRKIFVAVLLGARRADIHVQRGCSEGWAHVGISGVLKRRVGKSQPLPADLIAAANLPRAERESHPLAVAYRQEAERMYREGQSIAQIAQALKTYPVAVEAALERQGVPYRPEELSLLQTLELGRRTAEGQDWSQIAEEMGLPLALVRSV